MFSLAGCASKQQQNAMNAMMMAAASVRAVPVTQSDVPLDISAVGNVESIATVDIKSRVAGQVLRVCSRRARTSPKAICCLKSTLK